MGFVVSMGEPMDLGVEIGVNEEFGRCEGSGTTGRSFQNPGISHNVNLPPLYHAFPDAGVCGGGICQRRLKAGK